MSNMTEQYRQEAAEHFRRGWFDRAMKAYTIVIDSSPNEADMHKLYSNRCACFLKLNDLPHALEDALVCVKLAPDWAKGHSRLGGCYIRLKRWSDAVRAFERACEIDVRNEEYKTSLKQAQVELSKSTGTGSTGSTGGSNGFNDILTQIKQKLTEFVGFVLTQWAALTPEIQNMVLIGAGCAAVYFLFFRSSSTEYYGYDSSRHYDSYGGSGGGMSWLMWGGIIGAAYAIPPMFPLQLGQYAQPFFGMSLFHFMWILNMITGNRGMGGGLGGFGGFGGRNRRRY